MFFSHYQEKNRITQEELAREYIISQLELLKQVAYVSGNDSGEILGIIQLIKDFKESKISGEKALAEAEKIIHGKEAAINQGSIGPNTGGH